MSRRLPFFLLSLLLYIAFAAVVYLVHGPEPELNIDHIAYFKLADVIRAHFPAGDYWRAFDTLHAYSVLVAYVRNWTDSNISSLKVLLAIMTVIYLVTFEQLAFFFLKSRPFAVLFSLLSALFVSFGASFWGMTDFSASLHRTLVVPIFVLTLWFFFRFRDSPWRYATYPALVLLSLLHLSTYHMLLVLLLYEPIDFVFLRRGKLDRRVGYFLAGVIAAVITRQFVAGTGLGFANFLEHSFSRAWGATGNLSPEDAWSIELYSFPWRNMPLPISTLANLALSYSVIFVLTVVAAIGVRRREGWNSLDRVLLAFGAAVLAAAYGPQTALWILRSWFPIYPINFEEVRSINLIMIPSLYFVSRWVVMLWRDGTRRHRALAAAMGVAFVAQPILVLRAIPVAWREALIERMTAAGVIRKEDTFRMLYARQYLGLASHGPRFYYSTRGLLDWLSHNTTPNDRLLTDRNEFRVAGLEVVGAFQNVVTTGITDASRREWKDELDAVTAALATHDTSEVAKVAKSLHATIIIVPWPEPAALYQDENFSALRVN